jgi:hypothetical protein
MRYIVLLLALLLAACGSSPDASPPPEQVVATVGANLGPPTAIPEPTLTADDRDALKVIDTRVASMITAAEDLQELGQAIRVTNEWRVDVRTATQLITGGRNVISEVTLPEHVAPFTKQVNDTTEECTTTVNALPDVTELTIEAVSEIRPQLETCVRKLNLVRVSIEGFSLP